MTRYLVFILFLITGCESSVESVAGSISSEAMLARISSETTPVILDVRSQEEYQQGFIPGALHVPHDSLENRLASLGLSSDAEIVVYCHGGGRAGKAEKILQKKGFTNIKDLDGHWQAWVENKLPVSTP